MKTIARTAAMTVRMVAAGIDRLVRRIRQAAMEARRNREKVEQELFRGRYHLSSKNDDDLPIVR